jgi:hypothetical protein
VDGSISPNSPAAGKARGAEFQLFPRTAAVDRDDQRRVIAGEAMRAAESARFVRQDLLRLRRDARVANQIDVAGERLHH